MSCPTLVALLALSAPALAHMQMSWPYPLRSSFNPKNNWENIDYSMTNPLGVGQYPCKGYINNPREEMYPVTSWTAGSTVTITLDDGVTHKGGSCQLSLSYDDGKTWSVIQSYMGGCPIDSLSYDVEIPSDAPSGDAIFSWSWFNWEGNREMYQNCAVVTIQNGGSGLDPIRYPPPFVANVDAAPGCATIEGVSVVFPNPGANVRYGGEYRDSKPTKPTGFTGDCGAQSPIPSSSPSPPPSQSKPAHSSTAAAHSSAIASRPAPTRETLPSSPVSAAAQHEPSKSPGSTKCKRKVKGSVVRRTNVAKRHERLVRHYQHERLAPQVVGRAESDGSWGGSSQRSSF
ncbi:hypothetical protein BD324DRAFT_578018 [Kockovaella imperatae]|uniref:Chitin-binding type-4 domain-containing protein n=1 Tax=Kockovaella imperatae TaxID=4999 RepID=A0A1Y1UMI7_9TREE|nr:hypothetical protein BD324DRAFT_578018 [Kockovaella imperatae]ORX38345.1 hypothetical protein BD324DRAFT_578018 [Kockovaella imperatae]